MVRIVCIGELLVDMIGREEGSLQENPGFEKRAGGAPANVAVAASRLGADVEKVATVGDDEFGNFLVEKLEKEAIDVSHIEQVEEKTTLAFVSLDEEARPHFMFYRGADEHIVEDQLDLELSGDDIVHIGSLPFTREETADRLLEFVQGIPATVSFDPNLREDLMDESYEETLREVVEHVDMLTAAEEEVKFFGGLEEVLDHTDEIVVTQGSEGAELYTQEGSYSASPPEVEVRDTTGAGDALTGAYLAYREKGPQEALEKAVEAAALSTTEKGAMSSLPERQELE